MMALIGIALAILIVHGRLSTRQVFSRSEDPQANPLSICLQFRAGRTKARSAISVPSTSQADRVFHPGSILSRESRQCSRAALPTERLRVSNSIIVSGDAAQCAVPVGSPSTRQLRDEFARREAKVVATIRPTMFTSELAQLIFFLDADGDEHFFYRGWFLCAFDAWVE